MTCDLTQATAVKGRRLTYVRHGMAPQRVGNEINSVFKKRVLLERLWNNTKQVNVTTERTREQLSDISCSQLLNGKEAGQCG
jgi:hypothetical protein